MEAASLSPSASARSREASSDLRIHAHIRQCHRDVGYLGALGMGKFPDPIDRVVVIKGQQVVGTRFERIGFSHQFERPAGIQAEDDGVLGRIRIEELQDGLAGAFDQACGGLRSRVGGMRVAEDVFGQQLLVSAQLRLGIQPAAGVIQVDLAEPVKAGIVPLAQFIQVVGFIVRRVFLNKFSIFGHAGSLLPIMDYMDI